MGRYESWTAADDGALHRACTAGTATADELARLLGRPRADVRQRARDLGLEWSRVGVGHRWAAAEDALLRRAVDDGLRVSEIVPLLTRRSPGAVAARINALGLAVHGRRWTTADDYRLRLAIEAGDSIDRVAADLERTREAIRHRCRDLALPQPRAARDGRAYQRWTSQEEVRLVELRDLPPGDIARRMGRSEAVIRRRLLRLGAAQPRAGRFHPRPLSGFSHGEDRLIIRHTTAGRDLGPLARRLSRTLTEVEARSRALAGAQAILAREGVDPSEPRAASA
jgi:hypothetical protein